MHDEIISGGAAERRSWRSRYYRSLDAVVTAALVSPPSSRGEDRRFLRNTSNYQRVGSIVRLGCRALPGLQPWLRRRLERADGLPLVHPVHLRSYGTGATVYNVGDPPAWVLKIYRRSLGCSYDALPAIARKFKSKRERVQSWYPGLESLFPSTLCLVLDGVLLGRPAAAALQVFVDGDKHDFFSDVPEAELERWMGANPAFRAEVQGFAAATLATYEREGLILDFVGSGNVIVSVNSGVPRLHIVDYGIFERGSIGKRSATLMAQIEWRLRRLEKLASEAGRTSVATR